MSRPALNLTPHSSIRQLVEALREIYNGKSLAIGSVTLAASSATTAVTDYRVGTDSVISFMAKTANAAAEVGAGGMYVSARGKQTFTITHANNSQTDRHFDYSVQG